jgi:alpha-tubulin suppressor-like RCC1 family protein
VKRRPGSRSVVPLIVLGCGCGGASSPAAGLSMGRLSAGAGHTCAVTRAGGVSCWGSNPDGQLGDGAETDSPLPIPVAGLAGIREVAAGSYHTCARAGGGAVSCWGWNVGGQIGDGMIANRLSCRPPGWRWAATTAAR